MSETEIFLSSIGSSGGLHHYGSKGQKFIFIPVGKALCNVPYLFMYFDQDGNFNVTQGKNTFLGCGDMTPSVDEAYPSNDNIQYNPPDPKSTGNYAFGGSTSPSFSLYHELGHALCVDGNRKPVYSQNYQEIIALEEHLIAGKPFENPSEYDADRVGDYFQRRNLRNFQNGKDTFPFVWEIDGRYIKF